MQQQRKEKRRRRENTSARPYMTIESTKVNKIKHPEYIYMRKNQD